jgi:hypothetical protein
MVPCEQTEDRRMHGRTGMMKLIILVKTLQKHLKPVFKDAHCEYIVLELLPNYRFPILCYCAPCVVLQLYNKNQWNAQFPQLIFNFWCLLHVSNLMSSSSGREYYMVRQFNSRKNRSVSLGCLVRQTRVFKHVWTCSNLCLCESQTKWVVRSLAAEEVVRVRGVRLAEKWVTRIWSSG